MSKETILITGASSGIGAALAHAYAHQDATLLLWGRDVARLADIGGQCRERGATVITRSLDVRDAAGFAAQLAAADKATPIDLAIFNAGLGGTASADAFAEAPEAAQAIAEVNFVAPVVGANVMADAMARRGRGRIVLVGSIVESYPLPMAPTYAATKAGLRLFAESLGMRLAKHGVTVSLVSPGFIDTPMSRQVTEPKPFLITADAAAAVIARGIAAKARVIVVPWQYGVMRTISDLLPRALLRWILSRT